MRCSGVACGVCRCVGDVLLVLRSTGDTPLHDASYCGHEEVVKLLLEKKANVEAKDNHGACAICSGIPNKHNTELRKPAERTAAANHAPAFVFFGIEFGSSPCLWCHHVIAAACVYVGVFECERMVRLG